LAKLNPLSRTLAFFTSVASVVGNWLGAYSGSDLRRKPLQGRRPTSSTANQALAGNLPLLRAHCRQLERNNPTARAAIEGLAAHVIGSGIALQPDTGDQAIDKRIADQWKEFLATCAVDGCDLYHLQLQAFREVVTAGEFLWRLVILPERSNAGDVPLAVLPLEAEWIAEGLNQPVYDGQIVRLGGVEMDRLGRPQRYWLMNPELDATSNPEPVPAAEIIHGFERRRSLQARGEPWLAPVIERLYQEADLVDAELAAAKSSAGVAVAITSKYHGTPDQDESGDPVTDIPVGSTVRLFPDEDVSVIQNNRPSQMIAPFRQMLRGDIAAALRISQRFLDRDVSRANYSSMRADMLDAERLLGPVREWMGHATAGRLYRAALPWLALRAGIKTPRAAYRLIPDGQPYVDPLKDAEAAASAIASGLSTHEIEIGKRGGDYREIWKQLAKEREEAEGLGLVLDLSGKNTPAPESTIGEDNDTPAPAAGTAKESP
jgi:lambda family phage portal protein